VNANGAAAFRASPSDLFVGNKLSNSKPANVLQILEHAHLISGSVSFIQMLQTSAWKSVTLKAKSRFDILKGFTVFDLASNAIDRFTNVSSSTAGTFVLFSQVRHANAAVHPAGSNE
jgi:hypothetical protein